jgi:4-hydroxy-tetrahydrodipicolinate synthase
MYEAYESGDHAAARELHYRLHPLVDLVFTETNPAAAKWVLAQRGLLGSDFVRPPLIPLTEAGQDRARTLLAGAEDLLSPIGAQS